MVDGVLLNDDASSDEEKRNEEMESQIKWIGVML